MKTKLNLSSVEKTTLESYCNKLQAIKTLDSDYEDIKKEGRPSLKLARWKKSELEKAISKAVLLEPCVKNVFEKIITFVEANNITEDVASIESYHFTYGTQKAPDVFKKTYGDIKKLLMRINSETLQKKKDGLLKEIL